MDVLFEALISLQVSVQIVWMEGVIINYDTCVEESVPRESFGTDWTPTECSVYTLVGGPIMI